MSAPAKPRLVFYSDCKSFAGCENVLVILLNSAVVRDRYDVTFVYRSHRTYEEGRRRHIAGVRIVPVRLLSNDSIFHSWSLTGMPRPLLRILKLPLAVVECTGLYAAVNFLILWEVFRRCRPDVVHINNGGYPAAATCLTAALSARAAGAKRVVFTVNNTATPRRLPWESIIDAVIARSTDIFVTASQGAQRALAQRRGVPIERIRRIPNAILPLQPTRDRAAVLREFHLEHKCAVLCEVAVLERRKGQAELLAALARLRERRPALTEGMVLFLVGDGEERRSLEALIRRYRLGSMVVMTGHRRDYADFIAAADLCVLPSIAYEDMPLVILEAMSLGTPVVATRIAGIPEQIRDGIDGILLDPARVVEELPPVLERLLCAPHERARLAASARERYRELFTVSAAVNAYCALYDDVPIRGENDPSGETAR